MMSTNVDFWNIDLNANFTPVPGKEATHSELVLSDTMDHEAKTGQRTRILKLIAGFQGEPHDHPYWEELVLIKGTLYESDGNGGENEFGPFSFARRAPLHIHGPARSETEIYLIEINWYDPSQRVA